MAKKELLRDRRGNSVLPVTHIDCVINAPNVKAEEYIGDVEEVTGVTKDELREEFKADYEKIFAKKDGAYEGMLVGTALNLQGQDKTENSSMYRTSGGTNDIANGLAEVVGVKGESRAWNQLVKNGNFKDGIEGWNIIDGAEATVENGALTFPSLGVSGNNRIVQIFTNDIVPSHKYITLFEGKKDDLDAVVGATIYVNGVGDSVLITSDSWKKYAKFFFDSGQVTAGSINGIYLINGLSNGNAYFRNIQLFDLTLIYGAGKEPSTPEQFEADYQRWFGKALTYEEYDSGSIRNVKAEGIKTVGFNLYEGGDLQGNVQDYLRHVLFKNNCGYKGQIYIHADVETPVDTTRPTMRVYYTDGTTEGFNAGTTTKGVISGKTNSTSVVDYIILTYNALGEFKLSNICINLSWSGIRNGEYEPHWEETKSLPITSIKGKLNGEGQEVVVFPDGMKRAGDVYDEIKVENGVVKAVKRVGVVDLGSLNWTYQSAENKLPWFRCLNTPTDGGRMEGNTDIIILNAKYTPCFAVDHPELANVDKIIHMNTPFHSGNGLYVRDTAYSDATTFKSAMQGVLLYYELAEPLEYIIEDDIIPLVYKVDDFGTEEIVSPSNTIAPILITKYGVNAVDTIRRLPENYISAKSMDNFLQTLNTAMNGTWSKVWNSATNSYDFSFKGNGSSGVNVLKVETFEEGDETTIAGVLKHIKINDKAVSNYEELKNFVDNNINNFVVKLFDSDNEFFTPICINVGSNGLCIAAGAWFTSTRTEYGNTIFVDINTIEPNISIIHRDEI